MTTVQKWIKEQSEYVANDKSVTSNSYYDLPEQVVIRSYVCIVPIPQGGGGGGGNGCGGRTREVVVVGVVGELGGGSRCGGRTRGVVGELGGW